MCCRLELTISFSSNSLLITHLRVLPCISKTNYTTLMWTMTVVRMGSTHGDSYVHFIAEIGCMETYYKSNY